MNEILRAAYNNCKPAEWLEYGDERYIPFSDRGLRGTDGNLIKELEATILSSDGPTHQLMSGFIGSGKTTELMQLAHSLEEKEYWVVYVNTEDYLNLHTPATTLDLWVTIAAGFDRFLAEKDAFNQSVRRFWGRFQAFLQREVSVSPLKLAVPDVAEIEVALKDNPDFWRKLNTELEARQPAFLRECRNFVDEAIALLAAKRSDAKGTVLILDSFEKLRGDARNADDVRSSAETIFVRDWRLLQTPCHSILMVPPWLAFTETGADNPLGRMFVLPMCKITKKDGTPFAKGINAMFDMLSKRMDLETIFGDREGIKRLVEMSGGYPRDLIRMIQEVLLRAMRDEKTIPLDKEWTRTCVERIIAIYTEQYEMGLDCEDVPLYARIAQSHNVKGWSRKDKLRLASLFEHHFVLSYQNGDRWMDLHPLVRNTETMRESLAAQSQAPNTEICNSSPTK